MALQVSEEGGELVAGERIWLTADRERVVPEGDPEAALLLVAEGQPIDPQQAKRYGLKPKRAKKRGS